MKKRVLLSRGFTLMELLVVMVILGVLVTLVAGNLSTSMKRGRDNKRKSDLKNIATVLETYYNDKGVYPTGTNGEMVGCGALDAQVCSWGGQMKDKNNTIYMALIPADPSSVQKYYYVSNGTSYTLYAKLENTRDYGSGVKQEGYPAGSGIYCSKTGTTLCTYALASTNVALPTPNPTP